MKRAKRSMQYDHLMGTPMDIARHPINNLPTPLGTTGLGGSTPQGILPSLEAMAPQAPLSQEAQAGF